MRERENDDDEVFETDEVIETDETDTFQKSTEDEDAEER